MEKEYDLGSSILGDGMTPIFYDGETIEVGTAIFTDESMTTPAPDDRWVLQDGSTIVVIDGQVTEVITGDVTENDMTEGEELAEPIATPTSNPSPDVLEAVKPLFEELRGVIAELSSRLDKLENVEQTTQEESTSDEGEDLSKVVAELTERVENLSKMAGAPSVTKKSDNEVKRENNEKIILNKIEFLKAVKKK
jgi:hypothetical protein